MIPEASQLWEEGRYGAFRKDLLQALDDLNPTVMRFPGGCASEGTDYCGQVFWKNSIDPVEVHILIRNLRTLQQQNKRCCNDFECISQNH